MTTHNTPLAIIYDFDGTLAPGNMQEWQFLPEINIKPDDFWIEVNTYSKEHQADPILMYMHLMLEKARAARVSVRREDFTARSSGIEFFPGVEGWFDRINSYGQDRKVFIEHYLISSGNLEIIEGTTIADRFSKIYASKFLYDANDVAIWPAVAINFTTKTQYLFRLNKGAHDLNDDSKINEYVAQSDRPVPFENMIYIGDGKNDVPCFRLVKDLGGLSIAVYADGVHEQHEQAEQYRQDGRVNSVAPAVYTENSGLDCTVKSYIDLVAARHSLKRALDPGPEAM